MAAAGNTLIRGCIGIFTIGLGGEKAIQGRDRSKPDWNGARGRTESHMTPVRESHHLESLLFAARAVFRVYSIRGATRQAQTFPPKRERLYMTHMHWR